MAKNQRMAQSDFYCTQCGKKGMPIFRKTGQLREAGHLKKLYCIYCGDEINHAEIREGGAYTYEDFIEEFEAGRFKDGLRESVGDLFTCSCITCPFNKNGRCWNANNSADCKHKPKLEV